MADEGEAAAAAAVLLVSSERDEGWMENLPVEDFLVDGLACPAWAPSEGAEEAFVLADEVA